MAVENRGLRGSHLVQYLLESCAWILHLKCWQSPEDIDPSLARFVAPNRESRRSFPIVLIDMPECMEDSEGAPDDNHFGQVTKIITNGGYQAAAFFYACFKVSRMRGVELPFEAKKCDYHQHKEKISCRLQGTGHGYY